MQNEGEKITVDVSIQNENVMIVKAEQKNKVNAISIASTITTTRIVWVKSIEADTGTGPKV